VQYYCKFVRLGIKCLPKKPVPLSCVPFWTDLLEYNWLVRWSFEYCFSDNYSYFACDSHHYNKLTLQNSVVLNETCKLKMLLLILLLLLLLLLLPVDHLISQFVQNTHNTTQFELNTWTSQIREVCIFPPQTGPGSQREAGSQRVNFFSISQTMSLDYHDWQIFVECCDACVRASTTIQLNIQHGFFYNTH